jgi:hypothetical protein
MDDTTAGAPRTRNPLLLGGIVLAAVLAALLGYFVVVPMFGAAPVADTAVARHPGRVAATPSPSPAATTLNKFRSGPIHDPFKPLVAANSAGSGSSAGTTGTTGTSGTTTSTSPAGAAGSTVPTPTRVGVVEINQDAHGSAVMVRLDTAIHIAAKGETIAGILKVVAIGSNSATFLYGDASFTLRVGQEKVLS